MCVDRPWEDDVIYENTMDFDGPNNEGIFIDAGPQLSVLFSLSLRSNRESYR